MPVPSEQKIADSNHLGMTPVPEAPAKGDAHTQGWGWWEIQDSNLLPSDYESDALPNELTSSLESDIGIEPTAFRLYGRSTSELISRGLV